MGAYLDKPRTEKETEHGTLSLGELPHEQKLPFAVSSMQVPAFFLIFHSAFSLCFSQGWRKTMEDAHIAMPNLEQHFDVPAATSLFAVFDGHGGI